MWSVHDQLLSNVVGSCVVAVARISKHSAPNHLNKLNTPQNNLSYVPFDFPKVAKIEVDKKKKDVGFKHVRSHAGK